MLELLVQVSLLLVTLFLLIFFCIPYIFLHCKTIKNRFLFSGVINYPSKQDKFLGEPTKFGLERASNHVLEAERGGRVGVWVLEPEQVQEERVLIFYCHGASSNRGKPHRTEFYKVIQQTLGYTLVTFDYRGFGDSKGCRASDVTVVRDCRRVVEWVVSRYPEHRIVVWGHSLGSGISTKFLHALQSDQDARATFRRVQGLVLESAFISAEEAAKNLPAAKYWNYFPLTRDRIPRSMEGIFPTVRLLPELALPVLLLHALNDHTVPHTHSVVLRETCSALGKQDVELYSAESGEHRWVHRDSGAVSAARTFIQRTIS